MKLESGKDVLPDRSASYHHETKDREEKETELSSSSSQSPSPNSQPSAGSDEVVSDPAPSSKDDDSSGKADPSGKVDSAPTDKSSEKDLQLPSPPSRSLRCDDGSFELLVLIFHLRQSSAASDHLSR